MGSLLWARAGTSVCGLQRVTCPAHHPGWQDAPGCRRCRGSCGCTAQLQCMGCACVPISCLLQ